MEVLEIKKRDIKKDVNAMRTDGVLPAIFYGPKEESIPVEVNMKDFKEVWKNAGSSAIISLKGVGEDKEALIQDVDVDPVKGLLRHVDFYVIERGKKIEVTVPIEFVGEAPAEKAGHNVVKSVHEISIRVRPRELPQHLEVDISALTNPGEHITVGEIKLPESGEFMSDEEETIVSIKEAVVEKEPEESTIESGTEGTEVTDGEEKTEKEGENENKSESE